MREKKEVFKIVCVSEPLEAEGAENFQMVPQMWSTAVVMEVMPMGQLGVGL